jgi:membrane-bound inhibitor of C-type lysozyme
MLRRLRVTGRAGFSFFALRFGLLSFRRRLGGMILLRDCLVSGAFTFVLARGVNWRRAFRFWRRRLRFGRRRKGRRVLRRRWRRVIAASYEFGRTHTRILERHGWPSFGQKLQRSAHVGVDENQLRALQGLSEGTQNGDEMFVARGGRAYEEADIGGGGKAGGRGAGFTDACRVDDIESEPVADLVCRGDVGPHSNQIPVGHVVNPQSHDLGAPTVAGQGVAPYAKRFRANVNWLRMPERELHMRVAIVLAVLSLAACATPCPAVNTGPTYATYRCDDGSTLNVTFINTPPLSATIAQEGYTTVSLPSRIYGAGFRYSDGGADFSGRSGDAHWARPGAAETACRQVTASPAGS